MLRKSALLAIAATAALGLAMFSASDASARGHGGGHGGGGMHSGGHGGGHGMHGGHDRTRHVGLRPHRHPHWHVRYHRPIWYGVRPVYIASRPVAVAGPCTCLSKEYTPEGAVLFKDRCTNEAAMNPPAQAPQQTGEAESQQQTAAVVQPYQQQYIQPTPANAQPAK